MEYKDNELTQMMNAIKNLKQKSTNNVDMNINNSTGMPPTIKDEQKTMGDTKDTSFYSRIFHHNNSSSAQKSMINEATLGAPEPVNYSKLIDQYFMSKEFSNKVEGMVHNAIIDSVKNKEYMEKLISTLVFEYTNNNENLQKYIEDTVEAHIKKIIKQCINNIGQTLINL